jgi:hypothetical protein
MILVRGKGPVVLKSSSSSRRNVYLRPKSYGIISDDTINSPINNEFPKKDDLRSNVRMGTARTKLSVMKNLYRTV